jgi:chromosome partitioning protein
MSRVISIANQKGGVGKTTTAVHLGMGLVREGKRVLLIDLDAQANLTISLGYQNPDSLGTTVADIMTKIIDEKPLVPGEGILHHTEGVDLLPSNIQLSGMDTLLVNTMSRENILKTYVNTVKPKYDYILIDCMPSLSMLTINALAAADSVIIPVQPHFLSAKGLELLLKTVGKVRKQINPGLKIEGILLTMADKRANFMKDVALLIRDTYGSSIRVFQNEIPSSVRAIETGAEGKSIYEYDPKSKIAEAYMGLTKEVLGIEEQRGKHQSDPVR